jgi:hypothetical protein
LSTYPVYNRWDNQPAYSTKVDGKNLSLSFLITCYHAFIIHLHLNFIQHVPTFIIHQTSIKLNINQSIHRLCRNTYHNISMTLLHVSYSYEPVYTHSNLRIRPFRYTLHSES